jgi:hypothetical protein
VIFANHVALFFGCQHADMMRGHHSTEDEWLTLKLLSTNAIQDMRLCLHFEHNWDEDGVA